MEPYKMKSIEEMTPEEKAGQLCVVGFNGTDINDEYVREIVTKWKVGGMVFSIRNMENPIQIHDFIQDLQDLAKKEIGVPLIITINQEGGDRTAFLDSLSRNPGNMAIGATHNPKWAYEVAKLIGIELRVLGFNMWLSPVLDVNVDANNPGCGIRSFGDSTELVADMAENFVKGELEAKIAPLSKHFPGKGDSNIDAHFDLPDIPHPMERLEKLELVPFKRAINAGTEALMTSHVRYSAVDKDALGTFSRVINTEIVREKCGHKGVIMTDALGMKGLSKYFPMGESAVQTILAGGDIILKRHGINYHLEIQNALREAIKTGRISEERVNLSLQRIFAIKEKYCFVEQPPMQVVLWNKEHIQKSEQMCEESVTLVKNDENLLPLKLTNDSKAVLIMPDTLANASIDGIPGDRSGNIIRGLVCDHYSFTLDAIDEVDYQIKPFSEEVDAVVEKAKKYELIFLGTHRSNIRPKQAEMVKKIFALGKKVVWIALNTPYDLLDYPEAKTYICTYGDRLPQLKALCKIIAGKITPKGRLPVSIPGLFMFGDGITSWNK